jgi:multidrug efflux pump subunit AcrB
MTTLATSLGALPIALAIGSAGTSRIPLGIVIVGGLMFALILTLYVVPALYSYLSSVKKKNPFDEAVTQPEMSETQHE